MTPVYFQNIFNQSQSHYWSVFPKLTVKRKLPVEAALYLQRPVSEKEIKEAIFQCHPLKAPKPDGFNASFFQENWVVVGEEVTKAIQSFFNAGRLIKELNHTFITLVPKNNSASQLNDFRPISCCNVLYKFIS